MNKNGYLKELEKKINNERKNLDSLVLKGLDKVDLLELSCKLDELINEYYQLILYSKSR